jgi:hypothetical protein
VLCRGDRRDFCIIDPAGHDHSLARRIEGVKAAELRAFMGDIDRDALPSVAEGREAQRGGPERVKERVAEKRYEHFAAPVHESLREKGETPVYGLEPTWWERVVGIAARFREMTVDVAGRAWEATKGYWRDWAAGRDEGMDR